MPFGPYDAESLLGQTDGFSAPLSVSLVRNYKREGRRVVTVREPFSYVGTLGGRRFAVIVPRGFESDFASMPFWARPSIPPFGDYAEPCVLHDWLYALGEITGRLDRALADKIFFHALDHCRVGPGVQVVMRFSVRFAGHRSFGQRSEFRFRDPQTLAPLQISREPGFDNTFAACEVTALPSAPCETPENA